MRSTERLTGARSSSDLDQLGVVMSPSGHNSTIVPAYRPAPDYETAVMSKYGGGGGGGGGVNPQLAQLYSSQPSLHPLHPHNTDLTTYLLSSSLAPPAGYPLTTSHTYSTPELNTFLDSNQQHRGQYCHTSLTFAKLGYLYSFEVKFLIDEMWIISISTVKVFPCFS